MKRPLKISLLAVTIIAVVGLFLWMRALASWRPVQVGMLPKNYAAQHISSDGRLITAMNMFSTSPYVFKTFDLSTAKSYDWPVTNAVGDTGIPAFGWAEPFHWSLKPSESGAPQSIELQDPRTRRTRHSFSWKNRDYSEFMAVRVNDKRARILSPHFFREFDLSSDKMTHEVRLEHPFHPNDDGEIPPRYAISADGKTLYGCQKWQGHVWDAPTGKLLNHWTLSASQTIPPDPDLFSPDGDTVIFRRGVLWIFADSKTGKVRWTKNVNVSLASCFSTQGNEVIIPQKNNCEVCSVTTGHLLRQLPGPRLSESDVVGVTPDWIYTTNLKGEIFRWRAR